jgi:hypothetical protein
MSCDHFRIDHFDFFGILNVHREFVNLITKFFFIYKLYSIK